MTLDLNNKKKICVVGSGISGLSIANLLVEKGYDVSVYEQKSKPGGLIKCKEVKGAVYHQVGGHVFNSKIPSVKKWFNDLVNFEETFIKSKRNAKILLNNEFLNYPIENSLYQLPKSTLSKVISELLNCNFNDKPNNFKEFLINTFGLTLYEIYFEPYNNKIWNTDLSKIPIEWLEGKLPSPKIKDIILSNITRGSENKMVHSSFYYPQKNGSQHIVNKLIKQVNVTYDFEFNNTQKLPNGKWLVDNQHFDSIIYTGDIRKVNNFFSTNIDLEDFVSKGTTNVFCEINETDISWLYIPSKLIDCHRVIFSGNFSPNNNGNYKNTCTIEYSDYKSLEEIQIDLIKLPYNIKILDYNFEPLSYIVQSKKTRTEVNRIKKTLDKENFHLLGRFAEWEYYNMDTAINAAMNLTKKFF